MHLIDFAFVWRPPETVEKRSRRIGLAWKMLAQCLHTLAPDSSASSKGRHSSSATSWHYLIFLADYACRLRTHVARALSFSVCDCILPLCNVPTCEASYDVNLSVENCAFECDPVEAVSNGFPRLATSKECAGRVDCHMPSQLWQPCVGEATINRSERAQAVILRTSIFKSARAGNASSW